MKSDISSLDCMYFRILQGLVVKHKGGDCSGCADSCEEMSAQDITQPITSPHTTLEKQVATYQPCKKNDA